jgi:hypothetical protein
MATTSQGRAPRRSSAMHRNSHRGLITDDTNSFARVLQNARRKPCAHNQFRASTTSPRPAAVAAGKINSLTTHLRNLVVVSASRPVAGRFGFARHIDVCSPIDFPRRLRGASTLRSVLRPRLCCKQRRAGVSARLLPRVGEWWWMRWWWMGTAFKAKFHGGRNPGLNAGSRRAFHGRVHQGSLAALVAELGEELL